MECKVYYLMQNWGMTWQLVFQVYNRRVEIADDKFVPPGSVITTQEQADELPERVGSAYENINSAVVPMNEKLAEGGNLA
ncbi:hypothetical protein [Candidatus Nitrosocosmicus arcticus]|uniref:hypothetical protein n=1 Tax=Candidatus Nitrosocosmicus arcticus TaxID=2035267 RepID=UPI00164434F6|nr:hypothetical protein [Candidatus Nitrosocosmicus arcticus]